MHFINTSQILFFAFIGALASTPVFAMPARNVTGGIQAIGARQEDLPVDPIFGTRPTKTITKTKPPRPTYCGPNMKRQEGDAVGLKIVPVCD